MADDWADQTVTPFDAQKRALLRGLQASVAITEAQVANAGPEDAPAPDCLSPRATRLLQAKVALVELLAMVDELLALEARGVD